MLTHVYTALRGLKTNRKGIASLEYGVLAALVLAAVIVAVGKLATPLSNTYSAIGSTLVSND